MATKEDVTPNKRGARSRQIVLDTAVRLMAEHGYEAATLNAIVKESGIPPSSVYHYFGSKNGILLAVMERGAERFFSDMVMPDRRLGSAVKHLEACRDALVSGLERHPDFLRLLLALVMQPVKDDSLEVHAVVNRVRSIALGALRTQMALAFRLDPDDGIDEQLARLALASIDGSFVAVQAEPALDLATIMEPFPRVLVAAHKAVTQ